MTKSFILLLFPPRTDLSLMVTLWSGSGTFFLLNLLSIVILPEGPNFRDGSEPSIEKNTVALGTGLNTCTLTELDVQSCLSCSFLMTGAAKEFVLCLIGSSSCL